MNYTMRSQLQAKKLELHGEQPETMGQFLPCAHQHFGIWRLLFGNEHREERTHAMHTLELLREAHPDLFAIQIIVSEWGGMALRYIAYVKEGDRKMVRMLPETVRNGGFRRKALTPTADGRSRWGYPSIFLMDSATGFWQSIAVPRLEEKATPEYMADILGYAVHTAGRRRERW